MMLTPAIGKTVANREPVIVLPNDEHNQKLVSNVRPPDWVNPDPSGTYNIVVIGAGTAGLVTAVSAAVGGANVALIEKHLIGGDSLNLRGGAAEGGPSARRPRGEWRPAERICGHIPARAQ